MYKRQVLHAIYGAPSGQSTGDFWFSTQVDPIKDGENKYFYGYKADKNSSIKEVVKKRQPSIKEMCIRDSFKGMLVEMMM